MQVHEKALYTMKQRTMKTFSQKIECQRASEILQNPDHDIPV